MEELTDSEFHEIAARDRAKVAKAAKQIGYKEGAFDGRASVFQAGFDQGYIQGFHNAFTIGRYQGLKTAYTQLENQHSAESPQSLDLLLSKPTRGQCQICVDQQLINESIPDITNIQTSHITKVFDSLQQRYTYLNAFVAVETPIQQTNNV